MVNPPARALIATGNAHRRLSSTSGGSRTKVAVHGPTTAVDR
jgi:hypothetical protein